MTPARKRALAYLAMYTGLAIITVIGLYGVGYLVVQLLVNGYWLAIVGVIGFALMYFGASVAMDMEKERE